MTDIKYETSAQAVANFFIDKKDCYIDNLKLQKLVYISFGWYSAYFDNLLFQDTIEAWKHGPVIPSLYHQFKELGQDRIQKPAVKTEDDEDEDLVKLVTPRLDPENNKDALELLDAVYLKYGQSTGWILRNATHTKDTPWYQVYKSEEAYHIIDPKIIYEYYTNLKQQISKEATAHA